MVFDHQAPVATSSRRISNNLGHKTPGAKDKLLFLGGAAAYDEGHRRGVKMSVRGTKARTLSGGKNLQW